MGLVNGRVGDAAGQRPLQLPALVQQVAEAGGAVPVETDEIQAAVLDVKLPHLDKDNARRREIAAYYRSHITNPKIILPQTYDEKAAVWHVFVVRTKERDAFQQYLSDNGVQTIIHYPCPPHKQLAYKEWNNLSYPISEEIHNTIISLPISPVMTDDEVEKVVEIVNAW